MRRGALLLLAAACGSHPAIDAAHIFVQGVGVTQTDCRGGVCQHNENTDLTAWNGALWLVHRTAESQVLGPNSSLRIYRSDDQGTSFALQTILPAPNQRDLRDPAFYVVDGVLRLKALSRLPVTSTRDSNVDTASIGTRTTDGVHWDDFSDLAPHGWSFWRVKEFNGICYSAAYQDGDQSVDLYRSADGAAWERVGQVYGVAADTPLETELVFMPSGRLLAMVRMDGTDLELLGTQGRLRTKMCWAQPPYTSFDCSQEIDGQRLDGPLAFFWNGRLIVVARKHLGADGRKRTSVFELTGNFEGGPLAIRELHELPSAGDTSYAGGVQRSDGRVLLSWYSSDIRRDPDWVYGILTASDIWTAVIDPSKL
jgi:hypothetical protein